MLTQTQTLRVNRPLSLRKENVIFIFVSDSSISAGLRVGETAGGYPAPEGGGGTAQVAVIEGRRVTWQYQLTVGQVQQGHDWNRFYSIGRYMNYFSIPVTTS